MSVELLTKDNYNSVISFFRRQFKSVDEWCALDELGKRIDSNIPDEVIGIVETENEQVVGAVIAYRNPFSTIEWTIPVIAVEKGNSDSQLPSMRRQGRGIKLMEKVYEEIKSHGGRCVLADTNKDHNLGGSPEFLLAAGLTLLCEIPGYFDNDPSQTGLMFIRQL